MSAVVVSDHAAARYRQRIQRDATLADIYAAVAGARARTTRPASLVSPATADFYLVVGEAVFPVVAHLDGQLVAVTCLRKRVHCKADRRAWRAQRAEDMAA